MALEMMDWSALSAGDEVEVLDGHIIVARGTVDGLTEDREIVWLVPSFSATGRPAANSNYSLGRRMFHRVDGWSLRAIGTNGVS